MVRQNLIAGKSCLISLAIATPGGERAYIVQGENGFRFSSDVLWRGDLLIFGAIGDNEQHTEGTLYQSVKMQVADDAKDTWGRHYAGPIQEYPAGLAPHDFAALSIWRLISLCYKAAKELLPHSEIRLRMTIGIPMKFLVDDELSKAFLRIARTSWYLYKNHECFADAIPLAQARERLAEAYDAIEKMGPVDTNQIVNWIRSEAEAALLWAFNSPAVSSGPYFEIDIGAGTTNAGIFRIVDKNIDGSWVKSGIGFFGADSAPAGMDVVDKALAEYLGEEAGNGYPLRGREDELLKKAGARNSVENSLEAIRNVLVGAWRAGHRKICGPYELAEWNDAELFVLGGGARVEHLREFIETSELSRKSSG